MCARARMSIYTSFRCVYVLSWVCVSVCVCVCVCFHTFSCHVHCIYKHLHINMHMNTEPDSEISRHTHIQRPHTHMIVRRRELIMTIFRIYMLDSEFTCRWFHLQFKSHMFWTTLQSRTLCSHVSFFTHLREVYHRRAQSLEVIARLCLQHLCVCAFVRACVCACWRVSAAVLIWISNFTASIIST